MHLPDAVLDFEVEVVTPVEAVNELFPVSVKETAAAVSSGVIVKVLISAWSLPVPDPVLIFTFS